MAVAVIALVIGVRLGERNAQDPKGAATPTASPAGGGASTSVTTRVARNHRVELTPAGLAARTLVIAVGDTVTFVNTTDGSFWPASDPHPTHDQCPGFDARRVLRRGETYVVPFMTPQICGFHDHTDAGNASRQGIITVR